MFRHFFGLSAAVISLTFAGCQSAHVLDPSQVAPDPTPALLDNGTTPPSTAPTLTSSADPAATGDAAASGSTPVIVSDSPTPDASPSPTTDPNRYESDSFFFVKAENWSVEVAALQPERLVIHPTYGKGTFEIDSDAVSTNLKDYQSREAQSAGTGVVSNVSYTLDQIPGFSITANEDVNGDKLYVVKRGFVYRSRYFTITSSYDKRTPEATQVDKDAKAMIATFKWL